MYNLTINVTKEIIEKSKNCKSNDSSNNCAIALAVRDIFPDAAVGSDYIYPNGEMGDLSYGMPMPSHAQRFIETFDSLGLLNLFEERMLLKPISFDIKVPDAVINSINIDEIKKVLIDHPTLELVEV